MNRLMLLNGDCRKVLKTLNRSVIECLASCIKAIPKRENRWIHNALRRASALSRSRILFARSQSDQEFGILLFDNQIRLEHHGDVGSDLEPSEDFILGGLSNKLC